MRHVDLVYKVKQSRSLVLCFYMFLVMILFFVLDKIGFPQCVIVVVILTCLDCEACISTRGNWYACC
jgi:hypothetical protein